MYNTAKDQAKEIEKVLDTLEETLASQSALLETIARMYEEGLLSKAQLDEIERRYSEIKKEVLKEMKEV